MKIIMKGYKVSGRLYLYVPREVKHRFKDTPLYFTYEFDTTKLKKRTNENETNKSKQS